jgi:hypothetical protein
MATKPTIKAYSIRSCPRVSSQILRHDVLFFIGVLPCECRLQPIAQLQLRLRTEARAVGANRDSLTVEKQLHSQERAQPHTSEGVWGEDGERSIHFQEADSRSAPVAQLFSSIRLSSGEVSVSFCCNRYSSFITHLGCGAITTMAEVMPHVPATGSRSWANADWRAGEARQDEMRAEFGNTLANGGGSDGEEPMCPGCAKWASQRSESMAEAGRLIELLRARASQESRGANLAWGLAASGWLLLAAAVARLVASRTLF